MTSQHPASQDQEHRSRRWLFLMILMVIFSLLCLALSLWLPGLLRRSMIGLPLHSVLLADYNRDPSGYAMPELELALIDNVLIDEPGAALVLERVATLRNNLLTLVPTVTPRGPQPAATLALPSPTPTQKPAGSASATPLLLTPTVQPTRTLSPTATSTPSVLPPTRTAARTATMTMPPPTRTATASPTGTATTQPPQPTATQPAPTVTPTEAPTIPPYPPPVSPTPPPYPLSPN